MHHSFIAGACHDVTQQLHSPLQAQSWRIFQTASAKNKNVPVSSVSKFRAALTM